MQVVAVRTASIASLLRSMDSNKSLLTALSLLYWVIVAVRKRLIAAANYTHTISHVRMKRCKSVHRVGKSYLELAGPGVKPRLLVKANNVKRSRTVNFTLELSQHLL